jgi:hypothetical protein
MSNSSPKKKKQKTMVFRSTSIIAVTIATATVVANHTAVAVRSLSGMENRTATEGVRSTIGLNSEIYSYCDVDLVGGDQFVARYPNPDLCVTNCLAQTGCNAATWAKFEDGTCYFKRLASGLGTAQMIKSVPNSGAVSFVRPDEVSPTFLWSCYGDVDMPGNDLTNVHDETRQVTAAMSHAHKTKSAPRTRGRRITEVHAGLRPSQLRS